MVTAACWVGVATLGWAAEPAKATTKPPALEPLQAPITCNGESVEVTAANTLRCRYASQDFKEDLAFYTERARKNAAGRKPGRIKLVEVFIKHLDVTARHKDNPDGKIEGVCEIPPHFITEAKEFEKLFSDFVYAASDGAATIEYLAPVIVEQPIKYDQPSDGAGSWWLRPKWVEAQLDFLKDYKQGDADYMFFFLDVVKIKGTDKLLWPAYGGMAWGDEEMKGTRLLTLNDHELARNVHEWQHHIFDTTLQETEDLTISRLHGFGDAGYSSGGPQWDGKLGPCLIYYRDLMRYYYTRDMWERWRLKGQHHLPHAAFSNKAYVWNDVKNDYWYHLPQLKSKELALLTGLKSVEVQTQDANVLLKADPQASVSSPVLATADGNDCTLNNNVAFNYESAAVLKTPTGTWLFVKPQLMDFYVNMTRIAGDPKAKPLPVYGYVLEAQKALLALKLPDGMKLPATEAGFFK